MNTRIGEVENGQTGLRSFEENPVVGLGMRRAFGRGEPEQPGNHIRSGIEDVPSLPTTPGEKQLTRLRNHIQVPKPGSCPVPVQRVDMAHGFLTETVPRQVDGCRCTNLPGDACTSQDGMIEDHRTPVPVHISFPKDIEFLTRLHRGIHRWVRLLPLPMDTLSGEGASGIVQVVI